MKGVNKVQNRSGSEKQAESAQDSTPVDEVSVSAAGEEASILKIANDTRQQVADDVEFTLSNDPKVLAKFL